MSASYYDYYRILQVDPAAEQEVIEAAYRRLARKYHPDNNPSSDATLRMQEINEAYEVLRDPVRRAQYDEERSAWFSESEQEQQPTWQQALEEEESQEVETTAAEAPKVVRSSVPIFGIVVVAGFLMLLVLGLTLVGSFALTPLWDTISTVFKPSAGRPTIMISLPQSGSQFRPGDDVVVQSTATDPTGIARVELAVDGANVRIDPAPIPGQRSFTLVQRWKAASGSHTLSVRAFNTAGVGSDPAFVSVFVTGSQALGATQVTLGIPTATRPPPTLPRLTVPSISPTPAVPPGVYATAIRVDPVAPKRTQYVTFFVTFLNTTGGFQAYNWRVRIFEPDKRNSLGDTAPLKSDIPSGTSVLASVDNWRVIGPGGCLTLFARVFWIDPDGKVENEFLKPDGSGGPATEFRVCP